MTTFPDRFKEIHLAVCDSTNDYLKKGIARLEADFPIMVSADAQTAGRGRESRAWISPAHLGMYVTFGFFLADKRDLPLLPTASGVAACDMLRDWTGMEFALKWPNDILAAGKKIAGILCETMIKGDRIACLVGFGINVNQRQGDFPPELRERAGSLRLLTGREWLAAEGRDRLAMAFATWLRRLAADPGAVIGRARLLGRPFLDRQVSFQHQGTIRRGICRGLADDGGLLFEEAGGVKTVYFSGEISSWEPRG